MSEQLSSRTTATFRAEGSSVGVVTILEVTTFRTITVDGRTTVLEGLKSYATTNGQPVNKDESGFTLARTGERLEVLTGK